MRQARRTRHFFAKARRGEEKKIWKILPSSRASREMPRSSNLARKAPVMQATETQVKLHIITSRSREKNAKPMSAKSPNSFTFELSNQLNLYVWLRDKFCCLYSCTRSNHWWKMVLFCFSTVVFLSLVTVKYVQLFCKIKKRRFIDILVNDLLFLVPWVPCSNTDQPHLKFCWVAHREVCT